MEENQKLFLVEEWGVVGLVQQLDICFHVEVVGKRFPVAALQALAGISKCRKQMVTAGSCFHLRRLAEKAVPGSRRLLERLEGGKLRSIISKTLMVGRDFSLLCSSSCLEVAECCYGFAGVVLNLNLRVNSFCRSTRSPIDHASEVEPLDRSARNTALADQCTNIRSRHGLIARASLHL